MKQQDMEKIETLAVDGVDHIRAFLASSDSKLGVKFQKAKLALGVLSAYGRLRATDTNRAAIILAARAVAVGPRQLGLPEPK